MYSRTSTLTLCAVRRVQFTMWLAECLGIVDALRTKDADTQVLLLKILRNLSEMRDKSTAPFTEVLLCSLSLCNLISQCRRMRYVHLSKCSERFRLSQLCFSSTSSSTCAPCYPTRPLTPTDTQQPLLS